MSWGAVIGKIFDWLPGRREHYRNEIESIRREMDGIQKRRPFTTRDADLYMRLSSKLRILEQKAKNG